MEDMLTRYTFDAYIANDEQRARLKKAAKSFTDASHGWWYISGMAGSGKTHLCTAICAEMIGAGYNTQYVLWRDITTRLKSLILDTERYGQEIRRLKTVPVLYVDDFFKGTVTDADINLAFEIINARYNVSSCRTIISSELPITRILEIDEALGSRIYERAKGFTFNAPKENWRLNHV